MLKSSRSLHEWSCVTVDAAATTLRRERSSDCFAYRHTISIKKLIQKATLYVKDSLSEIAENPNNVNSTRQHARHLQ